MFNEKSKSPTPLELLMDLIEESGVEYGKDASVSYYERINSPLLSSPLPGTSSSESLDGSDLIPRVQFGEKEITEEIVDVAKKLSDAIQMRARYEHNFTYPWKKKAQNEKIREVPEFEEYDGTIKIDGQVSSGDIHGIILHEGVFLVNEKKKGSDEIVRIIEPKVSFESFCRDYDAVWNYTRDAPSKTFCYQRMKFLVMKFDLYKALYCGNELVDMKRTPYRDFYNVRKVDNHIHLAAAVNQKDLLNFIRLKMVNNGNDIVIKKNEKGQPLTLKQVCRSQKLSPSRISVDSLSVRATKDTFHRFDRFADIFRPFGVSDLRKIFLKVDNDMDGKYFGEITRSVFNKYDKYTLSEPRVSIYGISTDELKKMAHWVEKNKLFSKNVRWIVQVPRLFNLHKKNGRLKSFDEFLYNIFYPFFHASVYPEEDPIVSNFLQNYLVGFDSVDDESKLEIHMHPTIPKPHLWGIDPENERHNEFNPPYAYYNYYFWANINTLNHLRRAKGMSQFSYRPHTGEAGDIRHLASSFLLADSINHGIQLRLSPVLTYLYYLTRIGISVSPLSNNYLFLEFNENPFPEFFKAGMNVSLSTDDPLMFHNTEEPLMEEYSIAQQIMKLTTADICELARNSVLQSGWTREYKQAWVSDYFDEFGVQSNDISKTNVPQVRIQFRHESFLEEHLFIQSVLNQVNKFIGKEKKRKNNKNDDDDDEEEEEEEEEDLFLKKQKEEDEKLPREELVHLILNLHSNKIRLFSHDMQMDYVDLSEKKKKKKKKKRMKKKKKKRGSMVCEEEDFFRLFRTNGKEEEEEEEIEGEKVDGDVDQNNMKNDKNEIEELEKELMVLKAKIRGLKQLKERKKVVKKRKEELEKQFLGRYYVLRKK